MGITNFGLTLTQSKCSNNCVFCNGRKMGNIEENVKVELAKLRKVVAKQKITHIEISGNDPAEYPGLPEFIGKIKKIANPEVLQVFTYGGPLKDLSYFKRLIDKGLTNLRIPLYGDCAEIHDAITDTKGSFNDLIEFFENVVKLKFKIDVVSLILRENQNSLRRLFFAFSKMHFSNSFRICLPAYVETQKRFQKSVPDFNELRNSLGDALKYALFKKLKLEVADIPFCLIGFDYPFMTNTTIAQKAYEVRRGDKDAMDIIDGEVFPKYMIKFKSEKCKSCKYDARCQGIFKTYFDKGFFEFKPIKD